MRIDPIESSIRSFRSLLLVFNLRPISAPNISNVFIGASYLVSTSGLILSTLAMPKLVGSAKSLEGWNTNCGV